MNLFIVKWGEYAATAADLQSALASDAMHAKLADGYESDQWVSPCSSLAFACVHEGPDRAAPRRYVHHDADSIVTFDGLPVDSNRRFSAHIAGELAKNWQRFDANVDGFYGALRISKSPLRLEVQTDLFGVYKIYRWTDGKSWLLSNSIAAIDHLVADLDFDSRATSLFFCLSWVPGEYTLLDGVRCLAPRQRSTWIEGTSEPSIQHTLELRELFQYPSRNLTEEMVEGLHSKLVGVFESIGTDFPNVLCPLTGGKDSRLLAALLHDAGVPARSYTYGNSLGDDGQIALRVADVLGIEHENILTTSDELLSQWDDLSAELVRRGDGMCPLQLMTGMITANLVDTPNKPVRLWGAGSSICRGPFFSPADYVRKTDLESIKRRIIRFIVRDYRGIFRPDAVAETQRYVGNELIRYHGDGVRPLDLPDVFWIHERGAARSGKNMRTTMNHRDTFSPFFARSFAESSFALSALQRATEPLHFSLMEKSFPAIRDIPFDKGTWHRQNKYLNLLNELGKVIRFRSKILIANRVPGAKSFRPKHMIVRDTMFERVRWLRILTKNIRERATDADSADLWDLVDQDKFMAITSAEATDSELAFHAVPLFTIYTVLTYRNERNSGH